jgi:hypothetical protein
MFGEEKALTLVLHRHKTHIFLGRRKSFRNLAKKAGKNFLRKKTRYYSRIGTLQ